MYRTDYAILKYLSIHQPFTLEEIKEKFGSSVDIHIKEFRRNKYIVQDCKGLSEGRPVYSNKFTVTDEGLDYLSRHRLDMTKKIIKIIYYVSLWAATVGGLVIAAATYFS
ncbi:MAG: hypothetical protein LIO87_02670 [Eubacterium sp.]|nr:hypothetical protein [Eubacterium sp.]